MNENEFGDPIYIGRDLAGFPFNRVFPPNSQVNGSHFGGYANNAQEVFFYDYAVQGYGVTFSFKGDDYEIAEDDNCVLANLSDGTVQTFSSPIELIRKATLKGDKLLILIDNNKLTNLDVQ